MKRGLHRIPAAVPHGSPRGLLIAPLLLIALASWLCFEVQASHAQESVCARVKMEVLQEVTLERQAFYAHLRIGNGLDRLALESVQVDVVFQDAGGVMVRASSDPSDTSARFFIRLDSLDNIDRVDGRGVVSPRTTADIHWLIIPAPGASLGAPQGTLYAVGATLSYTLGGERHTTHVVPDTIHVKPMPELALDYFLPARVTADDPFTPESEPQVPFSLGVRVTNNGTGWARRLAIDSAQPRIVDNAQGLPVRFTILGSDINGSPVRPDLRVDFGDIAPGASATARWVMTCPISGRFVDFKADFSHSDALGGALTSLMTSVETHLLVRDVRVDLPGRDGVLDFLARDGGVLRVYESDGVDTVAADLSASAALGPLEHSGSLATTSLTLPETQGFMAVELDDPTGGAMALKDIVRSDGKRIRPQNRWTAAERLPSGGMRRILGLFDVQSTGSYRVTFEAPDGGPRPPVLEAVPDLAGVEGEVLAFTVSATDADGTVPALSAGPLPATATFHDLGNGQGTFSWTPAPGQAGRYELVFTASDGVLKATRRAVLTVCSAEDSDCDGMADAWELLHFGSLSRDGSKDLDGDGVSDLDEFWRRTDPTRSNGPTTPVILSPADRTRVVESRPEITIRSSTDPDPEDRVTHVFELYTEPGMRNLAARAEGLAGPGATTTWTVPRDLEENGWYFLRVRATDGRNWSEWAYASLMVNTLNDAPSEPRAAAPAHGTSVDTRNPVLRVANGRDPEGDALVYAFELYLDETLSTLVDSASEVPEGAGGTTAWTVTAPLENHRRYVWRAVAADGEGAASATVLNAFVVDVGNHAPESPAVVSPEPGSELASRDVDLAIENGFDADSDSLAYNFELDTDPGFNGPDFTASGPVAEGASVTRWSLGSLSDNTEYFWRARCSDGLAQSPWVQGSFFVNLENDAPTTPTLRNPGDGSWIETLTPRLQLNPSFDPDRDELTYRFELYADPPPAEPVHRGAAPVPDWTVPFGLEDNRLHFWRGRAEDEHGASSGWTGLSAFFVNDNGVDDPPGMVFTAPAADLFVRSGEVDIRWVDDDPDSNAVITIGWSRHAGGEGVTLITENIPEDPDGPSDALTWDVSEMEEGTFRIVGTIADASTSRTFPAPGSLTVDRTPPAPEARPRGGVHASPVTVVLAADEPAAIRYTLDGSEPTLDSPLYAAPIEIGSTATLTFMAVDRAGNASGVRSETYTVQPGTRVRRFVVLAPRRVQAGLAFPLTVRAAGSKGGVVSDFNGRVRLEASSGTFEPAWADGFKGGVWRGEGRIEGAAGTVTISASWNGVTGESRPVAVRCDTPRYPVPARPRDGATLTPDELAFSWHRVRGASSYTLEVADDPLFQGVLARVEPIAETGFTPPAGFTDGWPRGKPLFWRLRAENGCGPGQAGPPRRFTLR